MTTPVAGYTSGTNPFHCFYCGYDWVSKQEHPKGCSRCNSARWDDPSVKPSKRVWPERKNNAIATFESLLSLETDECIVWPLGLFKDGYGKIRTGKITVKTHRLVYEKKIGPITDGLNVCHHCDNPPCMNYRHLFLGTVQENNEDKRIKKRHRFGETHPIAKLTENDVRDIRARYVKDVKNRDKRQLKLAEEYGVNQTAISCIIRRKTWKHLK